MRIAAAEGVKGFRGGRERQRRGIEAIFLVVYFGFWDLIERLGGFVFCFVLCEGNLKCSTSNYFLNLNLVPHLSIVTILTSRSKALFG